MLLKRNRHGAKIYIYRAFISYKHVASSDFARQLELALKRYAQPFLKPPLRIFRDEKFLRPGVNLPAMIRDALHQSEFLIFLASPAAAASPWIRDELTYWVDDLGRRNNLIIVLTDGAIVYDTNTKEIDWPRTTALPDTLRSELRFVPFYVDCQAFRDPKGLTLLDPNFKAAINSIAAALNDIDPIDMTGVEIKQHKRNLLLRNAAVGLISILLVIAVEFAYVASQERAAAQQNERRALAALAQVASADGRYVDGIALALASIPPKPGANIPVLAQSMDTLARNLRHQRRLPVNAPIPIGFERAVERSRDGASPAIAMSRSGTHKISWTRSSTAPNIRLFDTRNAAKEGVLLVQENANGATFSEDGALVSAWLEDGTLITWDVKTATPVGPVLHFEHTVEDAIFSPDHRFVIAQADRLLWHRDLASGKDVILPIRPSGRIWSVKLSGSGNTLLTTTRQRITELWDLSTGKRLRAPIETEGAVVDVRMTDDVLQLITEKNNWVQVLDFSDGDTPVLSAPKYELVGQFVGARLSPDGETFVSWTNESLYFTSTSRDGNGVRPESFPVAISGARFNKVGTVVATWSVDGTVRLWRTDTRTQVFEQTVGWPIHGCWFDETDSTLWAWGKNSTAAWTLQGLPVPAVTLRHDDRARGATLIGNGTRIATWSDDATVRLWRLPEGVPMRPALQLDSAVEGVQMHPNALLLLAWTRNGMLHLIDMGTGNSTPLPQSHRGTVNGATFDERGERVLSWSDDGSIILHDLATEQWRIFTHERRVRGASFNADETRVLSWGESDTYRLWDPASDSTTPLSSGVRKGISSARVNLARTHLFTWGERGFLHYIDLLSGDAAMAPLRHNDAEGNPDRIKGFSLSGDGTRIVTWTARGVMRIWLLPSGELTLELHSPGLRVGGALLNDDGSHVLTWSAPKVNGPRQKVLTCSGDVPNSDDEAQRPSLCLWDSATGLLLLEPMVHTRRITGALFDADDALAVSWSYDGAVRLWALSAAGDGPLVENACRHIAEQGSVSDQLARYGLVLREDFCRPPPTVPSSGTWLR